MSTRIVYDPDDNVACLYDSVTGVAFGEVFDGDEAYEDAERFLKWLTEDARSLNPEALAVARKTFREKQEDARRPEGIPVVKEDAA